LLQLNNVSKTYRNLDEEVYVLKNINLNIEPGTFAAIMGPSGSGKSTLLGVAAGLDRIDSGNIMLNGEDITHKSEDELSNFRASKIGFVFQNFQLIRNLTALENVSLPLIIVGSLSEKTIRQKAEELLEKVGMGHRKNHFPGQLSGGEEQRVAIARAFANDPVLLFADEPTGNLDSKNSQLVMQMLTDLNKKNGSTLIVVTHDPKVAEIADIVYNMKDGEISENSPPPPPIIKKVSKTKKKAKKK
jgi:putative ABC transport system ATP-binding protein